MERKAFGKLADGEEATLYTISNTKGMYAQITDFGASIVSLVVKDKDGKIQMWSLVMKCRDLSAADGQFWSSCWKKLQSYCKCGNCDRWSYLSA